MIKILLIGGGTGGHCLPMNVLYHDLLKKTQCYILTDKRGERYFRNISKNKVYVLRKLLNNNSKLANIINIPILLIQSFYFHLSIRPDCCVGFGGFITLPSIISAWLLNIKTYAHEANALVGKTNLILIKFVRKLFVAFDVITHQGKKVNNTIKVGLPIRIKMKNKSNKNYNKSFQICILGGSQGAKNLSIKISKAIKQLKETQGLNLKVFHQCREEDGKIVRNIYSSAKIAGITSDYFNDIPNILSTSNLIISRAGSSTLNEILYYNIPSILIPYPYAVDDHQYFNAKVLEKNNGAKVILDKELTQAKIYLEIQRIISLFKDRKYQISSNRHNLNASSQIYNFIEKDLCR